jgi:hypothetical protein
VTSEPSRNLPEGHSRPVDLWHLRKKPWLVHFGFAVALEEARQRTVVVVVVQAPQLHLVASGAVEADNHLACTRPTDRMGKVVER